MRTTFILVAWLVIGAMLTIAGEPHLSTAQQVLLGLGIALTMVEVFILLLCTGAWDELYEQCCYIEMKGEWKG